MAAPPEQSQEALPDSCILMRLAATGIEPEIGVMDADETQIFPRDYLCFAGANLRLEKFFQKKISCAAGGVRRNDGAQHGQSTHHRRETVRRQRHQQGARQVSET
jgi:hypothetical protein